MADMKARILALEKKTGDVEEVYEDTDGRRYYVREGARYVISTEPGMKRDDADGYAVTFTDEDVDVALGRIRGMKRVR